MKSSRVYVDDINFFSVLYSKVKYKSNFTIVSTRSSYSFFTSLLLKYFSINYYQISPQTSDYLPIKEKSKRVSDLNLKIKDLKFLHEKNLRFLRYFFFDGSEEIITRKLSYNISKKLFAVLDIIHLAERENISAILLHDSDSVRVIKILYPQKNIALFTYPSFLVTGKSARRSRYLDGVYYSGFCTSLWTFIKTILSNLYFLTKQFFVMCKNQQNFYDIKQIDLFSLVMNMQSEFFDDMPFAKQYVDSKKNITICAIGKNEKKLKESLNNSSSRCLTNLDLLEQLSIKQRFLIILRGLYFQVWQIYYLMSGVNISLLSQFNRIYIHFLIYDTYFLEKKVKTLWTNIEGDNYFVQSAILAAKKHNIITAGFSWSMPVSRDLEHCIFRNDLFFCWDDRQKKFMQQSGAYIQNYIEIGYPKYLHHHKEDFSKRLIHKKSWVIFFDNFYDDDAPVSAVQSLKLMKVLFDFLEDARSINIGLILKLKNDQKPFSNFEKSINNLTDQGRLIINTEKGNFDPEEKGIIALTCGSQSLAFASHQIGMKLISFDPDGYCDDIITQDTKNFFQIKNPDVLSDLLLEFHTNKKNDIPSIPTSPIHRSPSEIISRHLIDLI